MLARGSTVSAQTTRWTLAPQPAGRRFSRILALPRWIAGLRPPARGQRLHSSAAPPPQRPGFYGDSFALPDGSWFYGRRDSV